MLNHNFLYQTGKLYLYEYDIFISLYLIRTWPCFLFWGYGVAQIQFCIPLLSLALHVCFRKKLIITDH